MVLGPSGVGKTTLMTLLAGLRRIQQGSVKVHGQELFQASQKVLLQTRRRIGFIFQAHNLIQSLSVLQNVQIALASDPGETAEGSLAKARRALEQVGLGEYAEREIATLSGGQKQRVAIARGLVRDPAIVIADEPTASLDKGSSSTIIELFRDRAFNQRCCVVMVTHDDRFLDVATRQLHLQDGKLMERPR